MSFGEFFRRHRNKTSAVLESDHSQTSTTEFNVQRRRDGSFRAIKNVVEGDAFMLLSTQLTMHGVGTIQPLAALRDLPLRRLATFGGYVIGMAKTCAQERGKDLSLDDRKALMETFFESSIGMQLAAEIHRRLPAIQVDYADLFLKAHDLGEQDFQAYVKSRTRPQGLNDILPDMMTFGR